MMEEGKAALGRFASVLLLLGTLLTAPAPAAAAAGYCSVRIRLTSSAAVEVLNLAEIQLFVGSGLRLLPVQLKASLSTISDLNHSAGKCIDGDLLTYCRSLTADRHPALSITYPCADGHTTLSKVIVSNIADPRFVDRISAFTLDFLDETGHIDQPSYVFKGVLPLYTIDVPPQVVGGVTEAALINDDR